MSARTLVLESMERDLAGLRHQLASARSAPCWTPADGRRREQRIGRREREIAAQERLIAEWAS